MSIFSSILTLVAIGAMGIISWIGGYLIEKRKYPVVKRTQLQLPSKPLTDREKVKLLEKQNRALKILLVVSFFLLFILFLFFLLNIVK